MSAKPKPVLLAESVEGERFDTRDLIYGLQGICATLDQMTADEHLARDTQPNLCTAANILASMLARRVME